jgi:hypothetical protein
VGQLVLSQTVDLAPDQIAGHRFARPFFGDHGANGWLLQAGKRNAGRIDMGRLIGRLMGRT